MSDINNKNIKTFVFILEARMYNGKETISNINELNKLLGEGWSILSVNPMGSAGMGTGANNFQYSYFASTILLQNAN